MKPQQLKQWQMEKGEGVRELNVPGNQNLSMSFLEGKEKEKYNV